MDYQFQEELGKLILRLTVGILLLFHGMGKILNPGIVESIGSRLASDGWPASIAYGIYLGEVLAPLMIIFGLLARIGGLLALLITHTNFSVSSGVGFLALFGVSVQTGVIMLEYINQLRARGHTVVDSAVEGAVLRLRPIMMTMLVATLGLLPAAMSHGIGSDSQRPFAIVIVGGLISDLVMSIFLLPTLYAWMAGEHDVLPQPEAEFDEHV